MEFPSFAPVFAFFALVGAIAGVILLKLAELIIEHVRWS
jgi:hypothetical protein